MHILQMCICILYVELRKGSVPLFQFRQICGFIYYNAGIYIVWGIEDHAKCVQRIYKMKILIAV